MVWYQEAVSGREKESHLLTWLLTPQAAYARLLENLEARFSVQLGPASAAAVQTALL